MGIQTALIREGERLEELNGPSLVILQKEKAFHYGTDAVLLADFAQPRPRERMVDLGTGTGIIALLCASRQEGLCCTAVEIQPEMADMAARSVQLNGIEGRVQVLCEDFRLAHRVLGCEKYTLAVCNPPYGKAGGTLHSERETERIARHEGDCTIEDVCLSAFRLLRTGGRFAVVFPAPRMLELMCAMRNARLEPKRVRTVHHRAGDAPKLVLVEAIKGGGSMLHWLPPLILQSDDGAPTAEYLRIYRQAEPGGGAAADSDTNSGSIN